MKVYAIRQISTGKFLPEVRGCYTQSIPMPAGEMMPRLFLKRASAKQALQYWLGGVYKAAYSYGDFEGGRDWEGFDITPDPMRSPSDMEVVEFNLEE